MLDGAQGAVGALGELAGVVFAGAEEIGVSDLPLADLVSVGRGDAAAGGAARLLGEDLYAVVFPCEVEQAVGEVGDHGALVDDEAGEDVVALALEREGFPPGLARISDYAGANGEGGDLFFNDAGGEQVEFNAGGGVAGVGAAVDLQDDGDRVGGAGELMHDLGNEAAFALVAEGDADIGDEAASEREERHGGKTRSKYPGEGGGQRWPRLGWLSAAGHGRKTQSLVICCRLIVSGVAAT